MLAVSTSCKFYDDMFCSNAFYAEVGLVDLSEFNLMENRFLALMEFRLLVENPGFVENQLKNFIYSATVRQFAFRKLLPRSDCDPR